MTRDPAGNPEADDAWGPLGPPRPRRSQPAASRFPLGLPPAPGEAGSVPGYEFEGRRSPPGRESSSSGRESSSLVRESSSPVRENRPVGPGEPGPAGRPAGRPAGPERRPSTRPQARRGEAGVGPRRFKYTATVGQPPSGPPRAWPDDGEPAMPGFEFDPSDPRDPRDPSDPRDPRDPSDPRDPRDPRRARGAPENRGTAENRGTPGQPEPSGRGCCARCCPSQPNAPGPGNSYPSCTSTAG